MDRIWLPGLDYLKALLKFNLTSVFDVLIVAFVIYRLLLLIRGTRAVQLIKGIVVLVAATALTSVLNLYTINWLLRQAMTALVVALPVVFQPELRRALEKLGREGLVAHPVRHGDADLKPVVAGICRAAAVLSKNKVGALIVVERKTGLEEHIDTGVKIDGLVSAEFLVNIFIPRTPLHDGAVILRGNRVAAAACFLPLSENPGLPGDLGTRHRAGIGITEQSDAVAVIVSEETGGISLAVDGELERNVDEVYLRNRLGQLLLERPAPPFSSFLSGRA